MRHIILLLTTALAGFTLAATYEIPPSPFEPFNSTAFNKTQLHIGALIPFLLTHDKLMFHAAMYTAVRLINNDTNILKDYELVLDYKDSTVRPTPASSFQNDWNNNYERKIDGGLPKVFNV